MNEYVWIESVISAYYYNRETKDVITMIKSTINRILDKPYDELNAGDDDTDILMCALVLRYGDYGTSPRFGWIAEDYKSSILFTLGRELNYYEAIHDREENDNDCN